MKMIFWQYTLAVSCFIVLYNYFGYALIVVALNTATKLFKKRKKESNNFFPSISFIVAAYNEEDFIEKKINNSLQHDYSSDKIEFIFITDGSADKTPQIVARYPSLLLLHEDERKGKSAALNRAVKAAKNDILIFSDANTLLNNDAAKNIARHYADEKVGGVAGEKKILKSSASDEVGSGEGLYWKYESFLKKLDSDFYSVIGAAGELFSLRKNLFEPLSTRVILDDFVISMKVAQKGFRIIYEPDAFAMELPSFSLEDEQKRKIRIAAGGFQAIGMLGSALLFWKTPKLSFLYISHRVLRWTLSPICLIIAFISNLILFCFSQNSLFHVLFIAQLCFYLMAYLSNFISPKNPFSKICKLPYYFTFMNVSVIQGFFRFIRGRQPSTWEKAKRSLEPQKVE